MAGSIFTFEAYRSQQDMEQRKNLITSVEQGHLATLYRVDFHVKTIIGRGQYAHLTTIGFNVSRPAYPYEAPVTWVISSPVPYSPHFMSGAPVCIGNGIWTAKMPFGRLFVHIAKLLNWDELSRNDGYVGWNGDAIKYHQEAHRGQPITPSLSYPVPPAHLLLGEDAPAIGETTFRQKGQTSSVDSALFRKKG